jgi:hypothetical protein
MKNNQDHSATKNAKDYQTSDEQLKGSVAQQGVKTYKTKTNEGQYGKYLILTTSYKTSNEH